MDDESTIEVLQLVTTPRPFFKKQVAVLERQGISCTVLPVPGGTSDTRSILDYARFQGRVLREVAVNDFDIVHANYGLTAPTALLQPLRPVVLSLWGSDLLGTYGWLSEACLTHCDAVIVMSEEMDDRIDQETHIIPHGIDMDQFAPESRSQAREAVGWSEIAKHVLFPYDPSRSVKDYPRAEAIVDAVNEQSNQSVKLHAVYNIPHEQVPTYMNAADALLLTSKREGSPNSVKEALACNLPVVTTDVGDVADIVGDLDNCAICQTNDELVQVLVNVLTSDKRATSRPRVREHGLEQMGQELREVYDDVLGAR